MAEKATIINIPNPISRSLGMYYYMVKMLRKQLECIAIGLGWIPGWPDYYINVQRYAGPSLVILQLNYNLELFVNRREFFPSDLEMGFGILIIVAFSAIFKLILD